MLGDTPIQFPLDDIKAKLKLNQAKRMGSLDDGNKAAFAEKFQRELKNQTNISSRTRQRFQSEGIGPAIAGRNLASSQVYEPMNIAEDIKKSPQHRKLWETSQELESMFLKLMLNEQRKNVGKTKLIDGGRAEEIFEDMLYDEYALQMAKGQSFGLAENLYEELSRKL